MMPRLDEPIPLISKAEHHGVTQPGWFRDASDHCPGRFSVSATDCLSYSGHGSFGFLTIRALKRTLHRITRPMQRVTAGREAGYGAFGSAELAATPGSLPSR